VYNGVLRLKGVTGGGKYAGTWNVLVVWDTSLPKADVIMSNKPLLQGKATDGMSVSIGSDGSRGVMTVLQSMSISIPMGERAISGSIYGVGVLMQESEGFGSLSPSGSLRFNKKLTAQVNTGDIAGDLSGAVDFFVGQLEDAGYAITTSF